MMTERPTVIHPKTSIIEAAKIMTNGRFRHLPVVNDDGIAGMVEHHRRVPRAARYRPFRAGRDQPG